jgi:hypothetical protein
MSGTAGAFAPPIPHPTTTPVEVAPTGLNTGIMPGATTGPGQDSARPVRGVKDLARDAGAVTPMPVDPVPDIADKPKSDVTTTPDARPGSVRALARDAGAR